MYNSQYYTCEQIDQRLLQGYLDDYNTQTGQSLTKAQFLTKLGNIFSKEGVIDNIATQIGYYECDTAAGTAAKAITVANYTLFAGGSMKVKFANKNTANNATLNINSQGAKALYYQGERASATNSWDAEEVVDIYYDGISYYANNVKGGSGSGVYDVSKEHPTSGPNSDGKFTLEYILNQSNVNELIPVNKRYPGMSLQFVSTSNSKYVQFMYMGTSTANANFTNTDNWQGVTDELKAGSKDLATSGSIFSFVSNKEAFYSGEIVINNGNIGLTNGLLMYKDGHRSYLITNLPSIPFSPTGHYNLFGIDNTDRYNPVLVLQELGTNTNISNSVSVLALFYYDTTDGVTVAWHTTNGFKYNGKYVIPNELVPNFDELHTLVGEGFLYKGIAITSTNPGTPEGKVFYIAVHGGTYTNFSGLSVAQGISVLKYDGSAWSLEQVTAIDDTVKPGNESLPKSKGVYKFVDETMLNIAEHDISYNEMIAVENCSNGGATSGAAGGGMVIGNNLSNIISVKIRLSKPSDSTLSQVQFTLKKDSHSGEVLAQKIVTFSTTESTSFVECVFDTPISYSGFVYLEFVTDGAFRALSWKSDYRSTYPYQPTLRDGGTYPDLYAYNGTTWTTATLSGLFYVKVGTLVGYKLVLDMDDKPTKDSDKPAKSGGIYNFVNEKVSTTKIYDLDDATAGLRVNVSGKSIGDTIATTNATGSYLLRVPVEKDKNVICKFKGTNFNLPYVRQWVLTDDQEKILSWCETSSVDYTVTPLILTPVVDGYLYLTILPDDVQYGVDVRVVAHDNVDDAVHVINKEIDAINEEIDNIQEELGNVNNDIKVCLPDVLYAVVGDTLQLYYRSIFRCAEFRQYPIDVLCDIGAQYPRYFEVRPTSGQIGDHTITFRIRNNNGVLLGEKVCTLKVVNTGVSPSSELNVLCVGASGTAHGQWVSELKRRLTSNGGSPSGSQLTNINFVGRMEVEYQNIQVNLEATGGYSFPNYTSIAGRWHVFYFTDEHPAGELNVDDVYSYNGHNYTVKEINLTEGIGNISCSGDTDVPGGSGTLTKVSGTGAQSMEFSRCRSLGNPFVYEGSIDIQQYADDYCNPQGASHGRIDVVYTELFGNGTTPYNDDMSTRLSQMQAFITQFRAVFPNIKFCIGLVCNPDIRGGIGANYGAAGGWSLGYGIKYSNMNLCEQLQKYIDDNELGSYVFIMNWLNEFDEENSFQQTMKKKNVRMPNEPVTSGDSALRNYEPKEVFGLNGIHPSEYGYYQLADAAYRLFIAKFCQST